MIGMKGDTILVNGTIKPFVNVERRMIRLRLLNGSNARFYNFGFNDDRNFYQISSDGGFLNKPVRLTRLRLSPGERAEILVAFQDGNECSLQSYPDASSGMGGRGASRRRLFGGGNTATQDNSAMNIIDFKPVAATTASHALPAVMNDIPLMQASDAQRTRRFTMNMSRGRFAINRKTMDMNRIDETIPLGATEIWEIINPMGMTHNFHVHDVQFQILSRNGSRPAANEQGWKDTVIINPRERVKIIATFSDYADDTFPYMYHCHILEHEDQGMMGQFLVVKS
jgi:FtsP/CotA-like multicopper oxidase with cupredoxin domain